MLCSLEHAPAPVEAQSHLPLIRMSTGTPSKMIRLLSANRSTPVEQPTLLTANTSAHQLTCIHTTRVLIDTCTASPGTRAGCCTPGCSSPVRFTGLSFILHGTQDAITDVSCPGSGSKIRCIGTPPCRLSSWTCFAGETVSGIAYELACGGLAADCERSRSGFEG